MAQLAVDTKIYLDKDFGSWGDTGLGLNTTSKTVRGQFKDGG